MVKVVDGGSRDKAPLAPKIGREHEIKSSYDTENVLRSKFDGKVKSDFHHGLNKGTTFYHIPDERWDAIFGKNKKKEGTRHG